MMGIVSVLKIFVILVALQPAAIKGQCAEDEGTRDDGTMSLMGTANDVGQATSTDGPVGEDVQVPQPPTCGGVAYDQLVSTCCNGKVTIGLALVTTPGVRCCGKTAYDPSRKTCCQADHPIGTVFRPNSVCCGIHVIDPTKHVCCQGTRFSASMHDKCCGGDAYNSATEVCCGRQDGTLIGRKGNSCCFGEPFDNTNRRKFCCRGSGKLQTQSGRGPRLCCGGAIYNPQQASCCAGKKEKSVGEIFGDFSEICCGGKKISASSRMKCCEDKLYNTVNTKCCHGLLFRKSKPF